MTDKFIERNGAAVPCEDLLEWGRWFETADRLVSQTQVGEAMVSTVFLGLDHDFRPMPHAPILYETMVFGGPHDSFQLRYTTRPLALAGHERIVEQLRSGKDPE